MLLSNFNLNSQLELFFFMIPFWIALHRACHKGANFLETFIAKQNIQCKEVYCIWLNVYGINLKRILACVKVLLQSSYVSVNFSG